MPKVQLDLMFMSAVGEFVDEVNAKSTVLTVVSRECGTIGTTELKSKDHIYAWAFVKQFLDVLGYDEVELKSDNEPTTKFICEQVEKLRVPKKTVVTTSGNYAHEELGEAERAHQTAQAQSGSSTKGSPDASQGQDRSSLLGWLGMRAGH